MLRPRCRLVSRSGAAGSASLLSKYQMMIKERRAMRVHAATCWIAVVSALHVGLALDKSQHGTSVANWHHSAGVIEIVKCNRALGIDALLVCSTHVDSVDCVGDSLGSLSYWNVSMDLSGG